MEKRSVQKKTRKYLSAIFTAALNPFSNRGFIFFPVLFLAAAAYGQAPNISYSSPQVLHVGNPVSISPANSGGPVSDSPGITYATGFNNPYGIAIDGAGNLYVADFENHAIKKIPAGGGTSVIVASTGGTSLPLLIAIDRAGNIYFTEDGNNVFLKKIPAGGGPVVNIGPQFKDLFGVAVDTAGNLYVGDNQTFPQTITKTSPDGGNAVVIGSGYNGLNALAVDPSGNVYFTEGSFHAVKKIPAAGGNTIILSNAFRSVGDLTLDAAGNIYVIDYELDEVLKLPSGGGSPVAIANGLPDLAGITVDALGNLYASQFKGNDIKKNPGLRAYAITSVLALPAGLSFDNTTGIISGTPIAASAATDYTITASNSSGSSSYTISLTVDAPLPKPNISYSSPQVYTVGAAISPLAPVNSGGAVFDQTPVALGSGFQGPIGIAVDRAGNTYVVEQTEGAGAVNDVKKIPAGGGAPVIIYTGKSTLYGVATDAANNVYVVDNPSIVKIPAGGGPAVTIVSGLNPYGLAVDAAGENAYCTSSGTGPVQKINLVNGSKQTIASGFVNAHGIAVDAAGNVYVADSRNNAVKKIPVGSITPVTLASGFNNPYGVAVDASGNVYMTDAANNAVKEIPVNGGAPVALGSGFNNPTGVALDAAGNLFVADDFNSLVKEIRFGYSISPALPVGLIFDKTTGIISGTPSVLSPATNCTVTAINSVGSSSATVNITVNLPPTISYSGPQTYTAGAAITPLTPTSTGVAAPGYSSAPVTLGSGFSEPIGVAVDAAGNVYVADYGHNAVKKIPVGGGAPVTLGSGFSYPAGVAVDAAGNVYVADSYNSAVKKIPAGGGAPVTLGSGFSYPAGVAVDAAGNVYVADTNNGAVKKIPVGGGAPVTIGTGFSFPYGVAVDATGNVYVADTHKNAVKEIPVGGGAPVTLGSGFSYPAGVAVDAAGNVYVADAYSSAVKKIPAGGGSPVTLGSGFYYPYGVAVDAAGNVYVADYGNNAVKEIKPIGGYYINAALPAGLGFDENTGVISGTPTAASPATIYTITAYNSSSGGGSATVNINVAPSSIDANLAGLAISSGTLMPYFTAGTTNYTASVTSAITSITVTPTTNNANATVQVNGTTVASGSASANLPLNYGDNLIEVLVTSSDRTAVKTYKITVTRVPLPAISYSGPQTYTAGMAITPLTPTSTGVAAPGYSSAPVTLGSGFNYPEGVAVDAAGNVYVADMLNNAVKKIPVGGGATVTLGFGFNHPTGLAVDAAGNVFVADGLNNAIKKIPAGGGAPVTLGSGFNQPFGIAVDAAGNVYVADVGNNAVKEIPVGGGVPVTLASGFNYPTGVAVDAYGNVYVADTFNNAVKKIPVGGGIIVTLGSGFSLPFGVAVDPYGNVFVADYDNFAVEEIRASGGAPIIIDSDNIILPSGLAVDVANNIYVTNNNAYGVVQEIKPVGGFYIRSALPAGLNFANTTGIISGTPTAPSPATNYTVTAYNSSGSASAIVNIKVITASANADLAGLVISGTSLAPAFASATTSYTATVSNATASITVTPTTSDTTATVTVNGTAVAPGTASAGIPLAVGSNTIATVVTAQDGSTTKTYTITVTRAPSPNASLAGLALSSGTLSPSFGRDTTGYTASVATDTTSIALTPTSADANATIKVNGKTVISGTASAAIPLTYGANIINTDVTAQDKSTTKTYTVTVTRAPLTALNNAHLNALQLSSGTLSPVFIPGTSNYTATVGSGTKSINITPTTSNALATVTVNGVPVASGTASASLPLSIGPNTITTTVTAQDGMTTRTYTVIVTRISDNADLAWINLNGLTYALTPRFAPGITNYTVNVNHAVTSVTVTPVTVYPTAALTVNGMAVISGTASPAIPLSTEPNTIAIAVTALDGITTKTYNITVTRAPLTTLNNARLESLQLSSGTLSPVFTTGTTDYTASVSNSTKSITITPTTSNALATVTVNGIAVTSGTASARLPLSVGPNTITTIVTAEDGTTTRAYTVVVTRVSDNANLAWIRLDNLTYTLTPDFLPGITSYTANVIHGVTSITVTPITIYPTATLTVNGMAVASGTASPAISLSEGPNTITIFVTALDGITTNTYTIIVTRATGSFGLAADNFTTSFTTASAEGLQNDGIKVHNGISPNGDGIDDFLQIEGISNYPDNELMIMNRNGLLVYEAKGYDNSSKVFDGHSNKNGQMQLPGTYFYALDYTANGITKHKTGYIVLKY